MNELYYRYLPLLGKICSGASVMLTKIEVRTKYEVFCTDCGKKIQYTIDGDKLCEDCSWKRNGPWQSFFPQKEYLSRR